MVYGDENGWHDRLTSFNDGSITYDTIGNPLSYYNGNFYTFTWKNGRELATAQKGYTSVEYQYGADGLRTRKTVDGWDYEYYYSDGLLVRQVHTVHDTTDYIDFLYDESGTPYSFIYNGTQYYYIKNLQNDVIAIANTSGSIVVNYTYDAWGNILSTTGSLATTIGELNPIRYRSYYYDTETGFYYLESRYYDPAIRRFINADGYINANGDILGFNMYAYCGNNPVNCVDYSGEAFFSALFTSIVLGGAIGGLGDLAVQLWENKGDFSKVNWGSVANKAIVGMALGASTVSGAYYLGAAFANATTLTSASVIVPGLITSLGSVASGAIGYIVEECINGQEISPENVVVNAVAVGMQGANNFIMGGIAGSFGGKGMGPLFSNEWCVKQMFVQTFTQPFKFLLNKFRNALWGATD